MNAPLALSPVHDALLRHGRENAKPNDLLTIADLSRLPRAGVKGPGAAEWLAALGLALPASPNRWLDLSQGGLVARLGQTEYLVDGNVAVVEKVTSAARTPGVYPVWRQDASFSLGGSRVNELLLQTCNVDFRILDTDPSQLLMTSIVGVSVTVVPLKVGASPLYRLWCDGTYGSYLWETLTEIIAELGGGVALDTLP
jgi:sarcosine oxidase subunit gamma